MIAEIGHVRNGDEQHAHKIDSASKYIYSSIIANPGL